MAIEIKARISHGVIEPLERIDFPEGKEVTVTISSDIATPKASITEALDAAFGSWADVDTEKLKRDIYANREKSVRK
ncbi:antitoxin AF2212-like protein [Candidatus Magnetominusculus dajiuhuensis]|uniref:antitoxin AF2212-like protein n=1 Tax=Candidatus Magnetominusculus dajiuhuensis TaxID=3137712 RepID=UPI003B434B87